MIRLYAEFSEHAVLKNVIFGVQAGRDAGVNGEDDQRVANLNRADKILRSRHLALLLG